MRRALEFDIFDAPFLTDPTFLIRPTFSVHHKHIRFHLIKSRQEVDHSASLIDIRILHRLDILDHE